MNEHRNLYTILFLVQYREMNCMTFGTLSVQTFIGLEHRSNWVESVLPCNIRLVWIDCEILLSDLIQFQPILLLCFNQWAIKCYNEEICIYLHWTSGKNTATATIPMELWVWLQVWCSNNIIRFSFIEHDAY